MNNNSISSALELLKSLPTSLSEKNNTSISNYRITSAITALQSVLNDDKLMAEINNSTFDMFEAPPQYQAYNPPTNDKPGGSSMY